MRHLRPSVLVGAGLTALPERRPRGSFQRPLPSSASISPWISPFDATMSRTGRRQGRPRDPVTRPPASSISSEAAAMSHGRSFSSQKPSKRPAATYARSRAAAPARRIARQRVAKSVKWSRLVRRPRRMSYGKPVARNAWSSRACPETRRGLPLRKRPAPADRGEQLVEQRLVDRRDDRPARRGRARPKRRSTGIRGRSWSSRRAGRRPRGARRRRCAGRSPRREPRARGRRAR